MCQAIVQARFNYLPQRKFCLKRVGQCLKSDILSGTIYANSPFFKAGGESVLYKSTGTHSLALLNAGWRSWGNRPLFWTRSPQSLLSSHFCAGLAQQHCVKEFVCPTLLTSWWELYEFVWSDIIYRRAFCTPTNVCIFDTNDRVSKKVSNIIMGPK